ncbi:MULTISPECIES: hypothetical protein [Roseobacteraceae]|jgi:hypothetical protein|uniref:Uncharacterized protein n=1 Tax=Falsiruegeria mediterranea M17 TaxID=1200281 RepID=A0A2R8C4G0_9RHOB|nr:MULTISPECIES: hypothetical protein [Roseobacteraceae]SPJ27307.1 hypothetical protein TRM7615_00791 [Falsiruegeria mediterranea M17]
MMAFLGELAALGVLGVLLAGAAAKAAQAEKARVRVKAKAKSRNARRKG